MVLVAATSRGRTVLATTRPYKALGVSSPVGVGIHAAVHILVPILDKTDSNVEHQYAKKQDQYSGLQHFMTIITIFFPWQS
jgi:hypothetical protein